MTNTKAKPARQHPPEQALLGKSSSQSCIHSIAEYGILIRLRCKTKQADDLSVLGSGA
jgi:hypothetical protein